MHSNNNPRADWLDDAFRTLRETPVEAGPPADVIASTIEALRKRETPPETLRLRPRRTTMFSTLRYYAAAAAVLLAMTAGFLWLLHDTAPLFAEMIVNVQKAKSVRFRVKQKLGAHPEMETRFFGRGERIRYEIPDLYALILDTVRRTGLELDLFRKVAHKKEFSAKVPAEALRDPVDRLAELPGAVKDRVQKQPDETIDGRKCQVFDVKGGQRGTANILVPDQFRLWVDVQTRLPVRIVAEDKNIHLVYDDFHWDEALPDQLFSLNVPHGFRVEELKPAIVKANRIYYHQDGREFRVLRPEGGEPEVYFVPRPPAGEGYVADKTELSPDGRYLAMGYTHSTGKGSFPPDRVLLWDRSRPTEPAPAAYVRPEGELTAWRFSPDGRRLYVTWWEQGRAGTDVVELSDRSRKPLTLPRYKEADGSEHTMVFAAPLDLANQFLAVGQGLHVVTADGKVLRRLSATEARVLPGSVRVSPDGKQVVYATFHADRSHALFVVPLAGGGAKELITAGKLTDLRPRWSPDGKRIAYTARTLDVKHEPFHFGTETYLKVVDAGGKEATLVTEKVHPNATSLELIDWR